MSKYNAFISYSHAADGRLAPTLQRGLQKFAKAWYQLRALRLFRDETTLTLTPDLWSSIEQALNSSENFILMASREAATSVWVDREVRHWLEHRGPQTLYIVLTDGTIEWDDAGGDFDWRQTDALPPSLRKAYTNEPLYLDFKWARSAEDVSLQNPDFRNNVADLAAALHDRPKDELVGDDVRQHRRTKRVVWASVLLLVLLTVSAIAAATIARSQRNSALSLALAASANAELSVDPERSLLLSTIAYERKPTLEAQSALRTALVASRVRGQFRSISWPEIGGFSPDGELYLVIEGGGIKVVETETNEVLTELEIKREPLRNGTFSPDGQRIVATTEDEIHIWETGTWRHMNTLPGHELLISDVTFSHDGLTLATSSPESVRLWQLETGKPLAVIPKERSRGRGGVRIDPKGRWVAVPLGSVNKDGVVRIHRVEGGALVAELAGHKSLISSVMFSPDGSLVVTTSWDQTIRIWETSSWQLLAELRGHQGPIKGAAISPDGRWLVTGSQDRSARVWDLRSRTLAYELRGHTDDVEQVVFSTDGNVAIMSSRDNSVSVWETRRWRRFAVLRGHTQPFLNIAVDATGRHVLTASQDQTARIWAVRPDESPLQFSGFAGPGGGAATAGVTSPDGALVVTGGRSVHDRVRIWERLTGGLIGDLDDRDFHGFSPDGSLAVTGSGRGKPLHVWHTVDWSLNAQLDALEHAVADIAFSPDGHWLATADGYANTVRIWNVVTGQLLTTLEGHAWRVTRVEFAPDSSYLVTASYDKTGRVWATDDWRLIAELNGHKNEVVGLDISKDGSLIATSSYDKTVRIWDATTGDQLAVLQGHDGRVVDVKFSPDGERLVSSSWDDTARLWDTGSWESVATLDRHDGSVNEADFSPDGKLVVTAGGRDLRVWDATDGSEIVTLRLVQTGLGRSGGEIALEGAQFSPDGESVLAWTNKGNVYIYAREQFDLIDEILDLANTRTTRGLTNEEAARFLR